LRFGHVARDPPPRRLTRQSAKIARLSGAPILVARVFHTPLPMIRFHAFALLMVLSAAAAAQTAAPAGDPAKGRDKTRLCEGCHGIEGWRTAFPEVYHVPKLGGQHEAYIVKALQEYRSGERSHPSMRAIAASLSDADMADLAAYYSKGGTKTASQ
jgi:cytochrome c553